MSNPTQNQTRPKCYPSFDYRRTGFKAISDTILISTDGEIVPSSLKTSRSGNHGKRQYAVIPKEYVMYDVERSNLGNVYIYIRLIRIDEQCQIETINEWTLYSGKIITTPIEKLPQFIQKVLLYNKEVLPLFDYVYFF